MIIQYGSFFCSKKAVNGRLGYGGIIGNGMVVWWFLQQKGGRWQNGIWWQKVVELGSGWQTWI